MSDHHEEGLDNTNAVASIIETGDLHEVSMILGSRERIRHSGVIRPGIKIPLSGCSQAQKDIYARLLDEGHGFEHIDAEMLKAADKSYTKKTCLRPSNSDYFTIRDEDFKRPADAEYIRTKYADSDGKVRRIPCWLPMSDIEKVMPHNFRAFNAGGLRCVSFYDDSRLKFKYLPKGFTGTPKQEDWQILDTDDEAKASKACGIDVKFGGMYRVYVPGTRGAGEIICPTQSWYGLGESVGVLKRVRSILGRFDGLFNGAAFFELCKVPEMVRTPEGKKQQQWIVTLELSVDPMELAKYAEPQAVTARSMNALRMLTGGGTPTAPIASTASVAYQPPVADDDLPAGMVDVSGAEEKAVPEEIKSAVDALKELVAPHGLFYADMEILFSAQNRGECISEASIDDMKAFYRLVRHQLQTNSEQFVLDMKSQRQ